MNDRLPEHHLARFIGEIVDQLDLKPMERASAQAEVPLPPGITPVHPGLRLSHRRVLQVANWRHHL
jgi:hypothetical protein